MTELRYEITIEAPAEAVFQLLTERDGLLRWMAVEAEVDPVAGGVVRWTHENGATMVGRFVELEPPNRLVFTYGWEGGLMGVEPESTTVEITLVGDGPTTQVQLAHRGLPAEVADDHRAGWGHFLGRLGMALSGP